MHSCRLATKGRVTAFRKKLYNNLLLFYLIFSSVVASGAPPAYSSSNKDHSPPFVPACFVEQGVKDIESIWGGELKTIYRASSHSSDSLYSLYRDGWYHDGQVYFRLKNNTYLEDAWEIETHYEAIYNQGDTLKALSFAGLPALGRLLAPDYEEDDFRLMDLTKTIHETDSSLMYHRLDRLAASFRTDRMILKLGPRRSPRRKHTIHNQGKLQLQASLLPCPSSETARWRAR